MNIDQKIQLMKDKESLECLCNAVSNINLPSDMISASVSLNIIKDHAMNVTREIRSKLYEGPDRRRKYEF